MHMLGQMVQVAGADHILWGTDSIWNGSPQSQIERMRRFKIADDLIEKHGYPQLTRRGQESDLRPERRAPCWASTTTAARKAIKADKLSELRRERRYDPAIAEQHPVRLGLGRGWRCADDAGRGVGWVAL